MGCANSGIFLGCRHLIPNGQKERGTTVTRYIKGKLNFPGDADLYDYHRKAAISAVDVIFSVEWLCLMLNVFATVFGKLANINIWLIKVIQKMLIFQH